MYYDLKAVNDMTLTVYSAIRLYTYTICYRKIICKAPYSAGCMPIRVQSGLLCNKAVLSQGWSRDAAVNFGTYRSLQQHREVFTEIATLSN